MMETCMDLGSFSRCIFNAHAFFSLMKHMCTLLSSSATMVSFFKGCTFQIRVMGISISFTPCTLSYEALPLYFSCSFKVSVCAVGTFPLVQRQACSLQAHFLVHKRHGGLVIYVHNRQHDIFLLEEMGT